MKQEFHVPQCQQGKMVCHVTADNLSTDSWAWRKYGQKSIKGSPYPRNYYRCSSSKGCTARKQVERSNTKTDMFIVTYIGDHNHPRPTHRNSLAGRTLTKSPVIQPSTSISRQPNTVTSCSSSFGEEENDIDMEIETDEEGEEVNHLEQAAELDEVEASMSGHSNQTARQNMFEAEKVGEMHVEKLGESEKNSIFLVLNNTIMPPKMGKARKQQKSKEAENINKMKQEFHVPQSTQPQTPRSRKRKSQQGKLVCHVTADNLSTDLWAWRKYGQKSIKGSPYPRNYYRCSSSKGCTARKQVERSNTETDMFIVTYIGDHNQPRPTHRNSLAGSTRTKSPVIQPSTSISCQSNIVTSCSSSLAPNSFSEEKEEEEEEEEEEEDIDMEIETDEEGEEVIHLEQVAELDEVEASLSGHSNQTARQNMFEAETIPLKQEPLEEEIQASRAGCSAPCISLKLTEIVDIVRKEDDDGEVDSTIRSWLEDTVNGYKVDAEFMPILSKIIDKHGDIAKNCKGSMEYRSMFLDRICRIVYELDKKNVTNIKDDELEKQIVLVDDIKTNDVEVNWLHTRLTEIRVARQFLEELGPMKDRFDSNRESIEIAESTLKAFEDEKMEASEKLKEASKNFKEICKKEADWKEKLARSLDKSIEISQTIENATSKVKQFLNCSLINDLL